jgi:hypothetical protein
MTPKSFLETVVAPNVEDFHKNFSSLRHAHNAISSLDALAAHLYYWAVANSPNVVSSAIGDSGYRAELAERNSSFKLLRDIAKAQKHVHLTRQNPQVRRADQVTPRNMGWGDGGYGQGRSGGGEQVIVNDNNGQLHYVEEIVDSSLNLLISEMRELGADN